MKKITKIFLALGLSALFIPCQTASAAPSSSSGNINLAEIGSPDEAVIFYGAIELDREVCFSQMDPDYAPDFQKFTHRKGSYLYFVSNPVAPGSSYAMISQSGDGLHSYWHDRYPVNFKNFTYTMPDKPGLYYIGCFDAIEIIKTGKMEPDNKKQHQIDCLKALKEKYAGTAWEVEANKLLTELRK